MNLRGWVRTSLIEYPGHIATVLFTGGCDLRCPMCHNAGLVLHPDEFPLLDEDEVWAFLERRAGLVDGLVVSGGEPTLQPDLALFLRRVREHGLATKLDTNGCHPDVLAALLDEGLLSTVAMDVKAPPRKYGLLTGRDGLDVARIAQSIELLRGSAVDYEFRTTVVPGLLDEADVVEIARWLSGAARYVLQSFRPSVTLDPALATVSPYSLSQLESMAEQARRWVSEVGVRG